MGYNKLTKNQTIFADEVAKGCSQSEAYRIAYSSARKWKADSVHNKASALMRNAQVKARLDKLLAKADEKLTTEIMYSKKDSFDKFDEIFNKALEEGNLSAAIRAEEQKGKLFGLYNQEKKKNDYINSISHEDIIKICEEAEMKAKEVCKKYSHDGCKVKLKPELLR